MAHPGGRPPKFETPDQLWAKFEAWKEEFRPEGKLVEDVPDIEGFCDYIGAWRDLLAEYEKKTEFSDAIKSIKNWIYHKKKQLAMKNKMPAAIFIFDAKNNAGYVDKTEQDLHVKELPKPLLGGNSVSADNGDQENTSA